MDIAQIALFIVIIVLAILLLALGIQVFFILREFRKTVFKANKVLDNTNVITESVSSPLSSLSGLAAGIKTLAPILGVFKKFISKDKEDKDELAFSWTVDFPLFTEQTKEDFYFGSGSAKFAPSHHMFTAPHPDDIKLLNSDPMKIRGLQHDLVLNGFEIGGGSIRIHQREIQEKVFELIGFSAEQKKQFEHMLTAFSYGVPPHGGIAPGIDRLVMAVLGEPSVREVMAFPANANGVTAVMEAPSAASDEQIEELGISIRKVSGGKAK